MTPTYHGQVEKEDEDPLVQMIMLLEFTPTYYGQVEKEDEDDPDGAAQPRLPHVHLAHAHVHSG